MTFAPMMFDLTSKDLSSEEQEILQHPMIGGVILFARNYESAEQVENLVKSIRSSAHAVNKEVLIAVDHEGGRVQRFRTEFTKLPAVATLGKLFNEDRDKAINFSHLHGWLMASEVKSVGVDFSFSPVLDLDYDVSEVIGDRAFHHDALAVGELATAYIEGMRDAGMASTGKHFPGHGGVKEDSHLSIPVDVRTREEIFSSDIKPFVHLFKEGLDAVMPAHVIYPEVDAQPAGFSRVWLQEILRQQFKFQGVIFSDDLTMEGASVVGGFTERAEAAIEAGCDMILACNNRKGAIEILDNANIGSSKDSANRLERMLGTSIVNRSALLESKYWQEAVENMTLLA